MTVESIRNKLDGGRCWTQLNDIEFDIVIGHVSGDFMEVETLCVDLMPREI